jgi:hypothetical protein
MVHRFIRVRFGRDDKGRGVTQVGVVAGWLSKAFQERAAEPQVPPLRFAPVGMTILLRGATTVPLRLSGLYRIVIPTGAYPDFLLRGTCQDHGCGFP